MHIYCKQDSRRDMQTDRHIHTQTKTERETYCGSQVQKKKTPLLEKKNSCKAKHTFQKLIFTFLHKFITFKQKKVSFQYIFVPFKTKYCLSKQIFLFLQGPGLCLCQWESLGQTCVFPIWRQSIAALVVRNTIKERQHFALVVVIAWNLKPP